jgi:glycosyltransferase involved in cell wall biosynthesis
LYSRYNKNIKITIITVCYNSEKTIKYTLDSIANQTYKNFEHLIIDNNSSDKTLSIIKKYNHKKKIISKPDNGKYQAMNKGIKFASGDIIGFLNSDDFYAKNNILSSVAKIFSEDARLDCCYSDLIYVDRLNVSKIIRYWKSSSFFPAAFSKGWHPPHPAFFVRSVVYKKLGGFNLYYKRASDVELMMRFLELHKITYRYVPEVWINMRNGGSSNKSVANIFKQNLEVIHALKKHNLSFSFFIFFTYKIINRFIQYLKLRG